MTEAEKLFNQVFKRWADRQSFILSFRITSDQGIEAAKENVRAEKVKFVDGLVRGGEFDKLFLDKAGFFKAMPPEKLIEEMTEATVRQGQVGVDAASIVFAHSFLDGAAFDYCRVIALLAPRDWESTLDQRQVKLSEARELGYDVALRKKLDEYLEELERESLLKKADLLFARCKPPEKWSPMHDYTYDRDRLKILDTYRHEIIHGDSLGKGIKNASEEVDYLLRTVLFFMGLVNLHYNLRLDPYYSMTGKERPAIDS
jgi:hypothetical protein